MWRRERRFKQVDLCDLNPVRYKKERKQYNRIVVRENKTKRKKKNWTLILVLLIAGITFIVYPGFLKWRGEKQAQELMESFEEDLEDIDEEEMDVEEEKAEEPSSLSQEDADTLSKEEVIGIIKIETIDIRYPILEGTNNDVLNRGIGHISETAGIGESGNCVLCGHNGSRRGTFFTPLSNVNIGDKVEIIDKRGKVHIYMIVNTRVVEPRDNSIKDTDGTEKLTLFTCTEHGTKRFVCDCVPEKEEGKELSDSKKETR